MKDNYFKPQYDDPQIASYVAVSRKTKCPVVLPALPSYGIDRGRVVFPVVVGDDIRGYLHVFKTDFTTPELETIETALGALLVGAVAEGVRKRLSEDAKRRYLLGLLSDTVQESRRHFIEQGQILGLDPTAPSWVLVVEIKPVSISEVDTALALESVLSDLSIKASVAYVDTLAVVILQEPITLKQVSPGGSDIEPCLRMIYDALSKVFPKRQIAMGIGRRCLRIRDFRRAFHEAKKAIALQNSRAGASNQRGITSYYPLKLVALLAQPGYEGLLVEYAQRLIEPLRQYDHRNSIDLFDTVKCFVENLYCIHTTSKKLFIHPNTLRYRLAKASKITGLTFDSSENRLLLELAYEIYNYYKSDLEPE